MKKHMEPLATMCKELEEDLVLHYYGEDADAERCRLEQHLSGCVGCRRFLDDLHKLLPQMATPKDLPQSFWDNYYRETVAKLAVQQERKHWWRNLFAPMRTWMVPAFGTAAVAAIAFGVILGTGNFNFLTGKSQLRIPQEVIADSNQLEFFESLDMLESLSALEGGETTKAEANTS